VTGYLESVEARLRETEVERAAQAARADAEAAQADAERQRAEAESRRRRTSLALAASVLLLVCLGSGGWLYIVRHKLGSDSEPKRTLKGHLDEVTGLGFSPDGSKLVSVGRDRTARIWDLDEPALATRQLHASRADPAFFADGLLIATAEGNGVSVWDAASGQRVRRLAEGDSAILSLAISPDGRLLAVGREEVGDRIFKEAPEPLLSLWEMETGRQLAQFTGLDEALVTTTEQFAFSTAPWHCSVTARNWRLVKLRKWL